MEHVLKILEDEVEKRVNERMSQMLEKISRTYDISMRQLLRDVSVIDQTQSSTCRGVTAKGKQCRHAAKENGYCHQHVKQKPVQRVVTTQAAPIIPPTVATVAHTHTLPPLFLAGCPACARTRQPSTENLGLLASMCV
jgi:hypothetical protein